MIKAGDPYISFFPALPLAKNLRLGEWCIGTPPGDVTWKTPRFKELVLAHLTVFVKEGFGHGALLWHCERGFDGSMPDAGVWKAILATVCFIALDANDHSFHNANAVHYLVTSENAELFTQPIDEKTGFITQRQGGALRSILSAGWKIGEEHAVLPDAVVAVMHPVVVSQTLATALFAALLDATDLTKRRIAIALDWHRFALSNPRVVSMSQRLISLKTGFEAISGKGNAAECAAFLRTLFETTTSNHRAYLPWAGLLWSPRERIDLARQWKKKGVVQQVLRSELEDWFMALAESRNEIIHEGTLSRIEYDAPPERPLSRYAGNLFWTADRLLRESIKALLGPEVLLAAQLQRAKRNEEFAAVFLAACDAASEASSGNAGDPSDESLEAPGDAKTGAPTLDDELSDESESEVSDPVASVTQRDSASLLAALGCDAANKVRLKKVVAQCSPTLEGAAINERAARGMWGASYAKRSILITRPERDALEAAGAEFTLPLHWERSD